MTGTSRGGRSEVEIGPGLPAVAVRRIVERALEEDVARGDVTTDSVVSGDARAEGRLVAREAGVVAGLPVAREVFRQVDPDVRFEAESRDGESVAAGTVLGTVSGPARGILTGERVALNFLQRMSGVATLTARYVRAVEDTGARIVDTRKTTPGLRLLEKYAVRCGGGRNHRYDLSDAVLFKDNHRAVVEASGARVVEVLEDARSRVPHTTAIEVEVDGLDQLEEVLPARPEAILLDNMAPEELEVAVRRVAGRARLEASGGITLETVRRVAEAGVDLISVGALTHSATALDVALDFSV